MAMFLPRSTWAKLSPNPANTCSLTSRNLSSEDNKFGETQHCWDEWTNGLEWQNPAIILKGAINFTRLTFYHLQALYKMTFENIVTAGEIAHNFSFGHNKFNSIQ